MDKIKLRAWHKAHNRYYKIIGIYPTMKKIQLEGLTNIIPLSCVELERYVGVNDYFGNEIYEGDIVGYQWNACELETHLVKSIFWAYENYPNGKFPSIAKIIGNIKEKPELLEV